MSAATVAKALAKLFQDARMALLDSFVRLPMAQKTLSITAVIPAYNEAGRLARTIREVSSFVDEIVVVDDASTDGTAQIARDNGAVVIAMATNGGYIGAIKAGFRQVKGDIVVTVDADGEFSAKYIPDLVKPILDGSADMVQGHRDFVPRPSERVLTWIAQRKRHVGDSGTGLRAMRSELARSLEIKGACICGVLALEAASKGARIAEIPIELRQISKPRKVAWFHIQQLFFLLPWLFKNI